MITNSAPYVKEQYEDSSNLDIRIRLHEQYSSTDVDWHEWVFDNIVFDQGSNILELGCGSGVLWKKNANKVKKEWSITLTDLSEGMLDKAKQSIGEAPNFTYKVIDIQAADFGNASFDIVIANHMLYHVPNISQALAEVKRILKSGGTFYASTNGQSHMEEIYELVAEFDPALPFSKPLNSQYFGLENGERQLRSHFSQVQLLKFESHLRVTSVEDLAEYMFSIGAQLKETLNQSGSYNRFIEFLESKKNEQGYIRISKDSGLFVCCNL